MLTPPTFRQLCLFAALAILALSCYDLPTVDLSGASSSSSGGMGGSGPSSSQSSSSAGEGGMGGVGGLPNGSGGAGGTGGLINVTAASSSSSSSSGMGTTSVVQDCGIVDCDTTSANAVCCLPKNDGGGTCQSISGVCLQSDVYSLKCDDSADCGSGSFCCLDTAMARSSCASVCNDIILCKSNLDCPAAYTCSIPIGPLKACNNP